MSVSEYSVYGDVRLVVYHTSNATGSDSSSDEGIAVSSTAKPSSCSGNSRPYSPEMVTVHSGYMITAISVSSVAGSHSEPSYEPSSSSHSADEVSSGSLSPGEHSSSGM